jgi:hypothetical protein
VNRETSTADLVAAVISRWNYSSNPQEIHDQRRLIPQLRRQAPGIIEEWTSISDARGRKQARQHLRNFGVPVAYDAAVFTIGPLTIPKLNIFAHKAVLALHFEHFRRPLPMAGKICAYWKTKEDFANGGIPPRLLGIMPKHGTLIQGKWDARQTFEYRHDSNVEHGLFGCLAKLRRGLYVAGFTVTDSNVIEPDDTVGWISADEPRVLLAQPRFSRKA